MTASTLFNREALPGVISSKCVPTEYDIETISRAGITIITLIDDRWRRFSGLSLRSALRRAEAAQDPRDPIHHRPYPDPREVSWAPVKRSPLGRLLNWAARRR
ncbi:hypothetical protein [Microbacterium forte]|uniref:hypothetical protein n=1 Tax=Microbacterium forte TaxID=2982533 RepID=UPI0028937D4A|nr:hypothetical protein [Microbacterium sp. A(2022)]